MGFTREAFAIRCQANMAHTRQSRPDSAHIRQSRPDSAHIRQSRPGSGLGFHEKVLTARAEDAQGTPTQSHISPSILVYEDYGRVYIVVYEDNVYSSIRR